VELGSLISENLIEDVYINSFYKESRKK